MPWLYESNGTTFPFYYCCNTQQINCALVKESTKLHLFLSTTVGKSNTCCQLESYSFKIPPWLVKPQYIMSTSAGKMGSGRAITHETWYVYYWLKDMQHGYHCLSECCCDWLRAIRVNKWCRMSSQGKDNTSNIMFHNCSAFFCMSLCTTPGMVQS
jgi:hypothetical protein